MKLKCLMTSYGILVVYDRPLTFLTIKNMQDYLASRMEKRPSGHTDLVVFCYGGSNSMKGLDQPQSESVLSFFIAR